MTEEKFDSKHRLIERTALEVFLEKGFEHTTLEAVAERLGYTKQAIYYYYKSKEDLVASFCHTILSKARADIMELCGGDKGPEEKIRDLIGYTLNGTAFDRGFFTLHNSLRGIVSRMRDTDRAADLEAMVAEIPAIIMKTIAAGVADGTFRAGDPFTLSLIIAGMINGVILTLDAGAGNKEIDANANAVATEIIMKGILA